MLHWLLYTWGWSNELSDPQRLRTALLSFPPITNWGNRQQLSHKDVPDDIFILLEEAEIKQTSGNSSSTQHNCCQLLCLQHRVVSRQHSQALQPQHPAGAQSCLFLPGQHQRSQCLSFQIAGPTLQLADPFPYFTPSKAQMNALLRAVLADGCGSQDAI